MTITCARCEESLSGNPKKCPECGYHPDKQLKILNFAGFFLGIIVSLSFIGAIVGIPVTIISAYRLYKYHGIDASNDRSVF